ncbi:hypothetical protein B0T26DRAFT_635990 [Lasiosphaeria miniovina]|uniref:GATA-type domain-containing protein n=1 Tax=Lasiosphaeria miniovina TaxID=1954250 RepID=A0AA40B6M9_9PEZI|nr:uncharacterized protein B0T26DRAFT_635990 [Lasiosphaeria miniovina]KAK0728656.1 hypothetical protein B0T26DRAFT_635990 [Lasiosphaeria miniovina]
MATAALISPSGPYHSHHAFSGYPHSAPTTSVPGMISPVDSRRTSDGSETPHRQSLPSISEVFSGAKQSSFASPAPNQIAPTQSLPSPFGSSTPSRPFGDVGPDKNPSPRALHPTSGYPRPEPLAAFSDPSRPVMSSRPVPPPLNTFSGPHPSPPVKMEQLEAEHRHTETSPYSAGHQHPSSQPHSAHFSQSGRLPPGQLPLSAYPVSPRHSGPSLPSPFESRSSIYGEDADYAHVRGNEQKSSVDKNFESWGYDECMRTIATTARSLVGFSEGYMAAAREQHGSPPIMSRLPTETELDVLIGNTLLISKKLENIRGMVQQNRLMNERARENGGRKAMDDDDVPMYGDGMKQPYSITEVKKRRGRAAPPGRCHSCNRIDTPEWRRGPDGARTLCNACGLHYAKLERKRQLDQRSMRPKQPDERN